MAKAKHSLLQKILNGQTEMNSFNRFGQAKFAYGGPVLDSSQFLLLPQLPQKMTLASKMVKIDSKIIISLH